VTGVQTCALPISVAFQAVYSESLQGFRGTVLTLFMSEQPTLKYF
jgi:hypothetical protein